MKKAILSIALGIVAFAFIACSNDNETMSRIEVHLTDAPGDYEAVNVDIQGVEVKSQDNSGWISLDVNKGIYNILDFTNGLDTLLGTGEIPAGKINQIRLILGANNSIQIANVITPLTTPSAQQSGLKLNIDTTFQADVTYVILLDFDAARSIVPAGESGKYILKPVIRAIAEATSGAIKGQVSPATSTPAVYAISGIDTVGTAFADTVTGNFIIKGLISGSYKVSFAPKTGFQTVTKDLVNVSVGSITDLGVVAVPQ
ncbi:MAG: DUF4382 domain-containing protein [Chryseolinea sp.]